MDLVLLIGLIAAWIGLALAFLLILQLIQQNGRILARLEEMELISGNWPGEEQMTIPPYEGSLPVGVPAPAISLPDLSGVTRNLSEWRGQRVLLVFFDPNCGFCHQLLPSLVALTADVVPGRPVPVVITTGELEENRAVFDEAGLTTPVLLQKAMEVATAYKVDGTPMSYLVEADGSIGSKVAVGVQATLILAGEMASVADATSTAHDATSSGGAMRTLDTTRLVRDGLKEGTTAPVFRLPKVGGGELSLLDYRGKPVVVVFSDPQCGPCDALAPLLEGVHRKMPDLPMVMISRGDVEANRAKVAEYELTFPVALQRHWEISREYGMFATPIGFLIDEWGVIAADVAVGPEAIMDLLIVAAKSGSKAVPTETSR